MLMNLWKFNICNSLLCMRMYISYCWSLDQMEPHSTNWNSSLNCSNRTTINKNRTPFWTAAMKPHSTKMEPHSELQPVNKRSYATNKTRHLELHAKMSHKMGASKTYLYISDYRKYNNTSILLMKQRPFMYMQMCLDRIID